MVTGPGMGARHIGEETGAELFSNTQEKMQTAGVDLFLGLWPNFDTGGKRQDGVKSGEKQQTWEGSKGFEQVNKKEPE